MTSVNFNYVQLTRSIDLGIEYLESTCDPEFGFQSGLYLLHQNNNENIHCQPPKPKLPLETFTSSFGFKLLGPWLENPKIKLNLKNFFCPSSEPGFGNFCISPSPLPDDVDSTSVMNLAVLQEKIGFGGMIDMEKVQEIGEKIVQNTNSDGIIQTYFPPRPGRENRICSGVLANVLHFLYKINLGHDHAKLSENFLYETLKSQESLEKSGRYYDSIEILLCLISTAVSTMTNMSTKEKFTAILLERLLERYETQTNNINDKDEQRNAAVSSISLAARILTGVTLGFVNNNKIIKHYCFKDLQQLLSLQSAENGSWPTDYFFRMGRSDWVYGGNEISTIFSLAAIIQFKSLNLNIE